MLYFRASRTFSSKRKGSEPFGQYTVHAAIGLWIPHAMPSALLEGTWTKDTPLSSHMIGRNAVSSRGSESHAMMTSRDVPLLRHLIDSFIPFLMFFDFAIPWTIRRIFCAFSSATGKYGWTSVIAGAKFSVFRRPWMDIKAKYGKAIKTLGIRQQDLWDLPRLILPLENSFQADAIRDEEVCIVPREPNFQLPNVFLRTGVNAEYQKVIDTCGGSEAWDDVIDEVLEALEEMDLSVQDGECTTRRCHVDQELLSKLVAERHGYGLSGP